MSPEWVAGLGLAGFSLMGIGWLVGTVGFVRVGVIALEELEARFPNVRGGLALLVAGVILAALGRGLWTVAVWLEASS